MSQCAHWLLNTTEQGGLEDKGIYYRRRRQAPAVWYVIKKQVPDAVRPDRPLSCAVDASLGGIFIGACSPEESLYAKYLLYRY